MKATIHNVSAGTKLKADGGFTCLDEGVILTTQSDEGSLYVPCSCGKHFLDGQLDDGEEYIGFTVVEELE